MYLSLGTPFWKLHIDSAFPVAPFQAVRRQRVTAVQVVGESLAEHQLRRGVLLAPSPPASPTGRFRLRHPPFRGFRHTPFPADRHGFIFPLQHAAMIRRHTDSGDSSELSRCGEAVKRIGGSLETGKAPVTAGTFCVKHFDHIYSVLLLAHSFSASLHGITAEARQAVPLNAKPCLTVLCTRWAQRLTAQGSHIGGNFRKVRAFQGTILTQCISMPEKARTPRSFRSTYARHVTRHRPRCQFRR